MHHRSRQPAALRRPAFSLSPLFLASLLACTAAQAQPTDNPAPLEDVTVRAAVEDATDLQLSRPVSAGALGQRSALETPYSTRVVTAESMEQTTPNKLGDVFFADAAVSDNSASVGTWASYLTVRGMDLDWQNSYRIDGRPFISYATALPYEHLEQVELLKGASGFMYGFGSPGGMINYVTKKPTGRRRTGLAGRGGAGSRHRRAADARQLYRLPRRAGRHARPLCDLHARQQRADLQGLSARTGQRTQRRR